MEPEEPTGLTICLPMDGFSDSVIDNLKKLVEAKAGLIRKALSADWLDISVEEGNILFPWRDRMPESKETLLLRLNLAMNLSLVYNDAAIRSR